MQTMRLELVIAGIFCLIALGCIGLAVFAQTIPTMFGGTLGAMVAGIVALGFVMEALSQESEQS